MNPQHKPNKGKWHYTGHSIFSAESVGVYIPCGAASYPSSVLTNTIPAKVAGVDRVIMTTPPAKDGDDRKLLFPFEATLN